MQENMQEKSQIKQKILLYLRSKGISEYRFYKESNITRGILQQPNGISEENISKFLAYARDVNLEWLFAGNGDMLKTKKPLVNENLETAVIPSDKYTNLQAIIQQNPIETRPRIPFEAAAGSLSIALDGVKASQCEQLPLIPTLPKYDFTIVAHGDSMTPEIFSGDELACHFIDESQFIQWGRPHVLDTAQGVVVKRIFDNSDSILCRSINPMYPDYKISKDEIFHIALVVGLIRHF